ncbi:MAG: cation:proton antiporter [Candidatus Calescibacterium sp.]|nr:cation:proton antiporter [Candidatus Calescibacterium sp.]MCX7971827.1 cation:proton antiporter [bacterium]MDW8194942.1 cation:proton antiporter [Candidatus Calescibacterium sp.]
MDHSIFLYLGLIVLLARIIGDTISRFGYPSVIGEILVGVILGQSVLGLIKPSEVIKILAEIGVVLLLFQVGMEANIKQLRMVGINAIIVAFAGAMFPIFLSFPICFFFLKMDFVTSLFIGGTLAATSIGITVRVLKDLDRMKENFAQVVLGAAVVDDIFGVIILAALAQLSQTTSFEVNNLVVLILYLGTFFIFAPFVAQVMTKLVEILSEKLENLDFIPAAVISVVFIFSFLAYKFGSPEILGAFVVGLAMSRGFNIPWLKFLSTKKQTIEKVEHSILPLIWLFTPIFFVFIGLQVNLKAIDFASPEFWVLSFIIGAIAILSKVLAGFVVNVSFREKLMIGFSMLPRGEVGLIFAEFGRQAKIFNDLLYAVIVFVVLITTFLSPLALKQINRMYYQEV